MIDLDVHKFFDSVPWDLMVKAVQANTTHEQRWIVLYVRRWLAAPILMPDGRTEERDRGTPQGSAVSPVIVTCSCIMRSTSGWNASSRPWASNVTPMTPGCTARPGGRPKGTGRPGRENGRGRAGAPPGQDQDRVLQGQQPAEPALRGHVVYLPRLHVPGQESPDPGQDQHVRAFLPAVSKDALKKMNEQVRACASTCAPQRNWQSSPRGSTRL